MRTKWKCEEKLRTWANVKKQMLKTRSGIDMECNLIQQALKTLPKKWYRGAISIYICLKCKNCNLLHLPVIVYHIRRTPYECGKNAHPCNPSEIGPCLGAVGDTRNWIPGGIRVPINSWLGNRKSTDYHLTSAYYPKSKPSEWLVQQNSGYPMTGIFVSQTGICFA